MVKRRPNFSPMLDTIKDDTKAPISSMETIVPIVAAEGLLKYSLK